MKIKTAGDILTIIERDGGWGLRSRSRALKILEKKKTLKNPVDRL